MNKIYVWWFQVLLFEQHWDFKAGSMIAHIVWLQDFRTNGSTFSMHEGDWTKSTHIWHDGTFLANQLLDILSSFHFAQCNRLSIWSLIFSWWNGTPLSSFTPNPKYVHDALLTSTREASLHLFGIIVGKKCPTCCVSSWSDHCHQPSRRCSRCWRDYTGS